jgi:predicted RNA polymerase sigma factor
MPSPTGFASAGGRSTVNADEKRRVNARIPYEVPARAEVPNRLDVVLRVVYLVFNEGYTTSYVRTAVAALSDHGSVSFWL